MHTDFLMGTLRARDHLQDMGTWEDNIKMDLQEIKNSVWGDLDWIDLAHHSDRNEFHEMQGISWLPAELFASHGHCST